MTDAVAILPARGGSKRIPRKNIRDFAGKPALAWPLAALRASNLFTRIIVSTDDPEIADVAQAHGAEVPFLRAPHLSNDHAGTIEVIQDAITRLDLSADVPVCCIYPTALFAQPKDLQRGYQCLQTGALWAMTVAAYPTPIDRAYRMEGGRLVPRNPEMMPKRSQDLEPAYFDAGQFYWARAGTWLDPKARIWDGPAPIEIPFERAVDIDTEEDWRRAERLFHLMDDPD